MERKTNVQLALVGLLGGEGSAVTRRAQCGCRLAPCSDPKYGKPLLFRGIDPGAPAGSGPLNASRFPCAGAPGRILSGACFSPGAGLLPRRGLRAGALLPSGFCYADGGFRLPGNQARGDSAGAGSGGAAPDRPCLSLWRRPWPASSSNTSKRSWQVMMATKGSLHFWSVATRCGGTPKHARELMPEGAKRFFDQKVSTIILKDTQLLHF